MIFGVCLFLFSYVNKYLRKQNVRHEHQAKAEKKRVGCAPLVSVGVGLGDHLVAYNVKHCAARKGKRKGKDRR